MSFLELPEFEDNLVPHFKKHYETFMNSAKKNDVEEVKINAKNKKDLINEMKDKKGKPSGKSNEAWWAKKGRKIFDKDFHFRSKLPKIINDSDLDNDKKLNMLMGFLVHTEIDSKPYRTELKKNKSHDILRKEILIPYYQLRKDGLMDDNFRFVDISNDDVDEIEKVTNFLNKILDNFDKIKTVQTFADIMGKNNKEIRNSMDVFKRPLEKLSIKYDKILINRSIDKLKEYKKKLEKLKRSRIAEEKRLVEVRQTLGRTKELQKIIFRGDRNIIKKNPLAMSIFTNIFLRDLKKGILSRDEKYELGLKEINRAFENREINSEVKEQLTLKLQNYFGPNRSEEQVKRLERQIDQQQEQIKTNNEIAVYNKPLTRGQIIGVGGASAVVGGGIAFGVPIIQQLSPMARAIFGKHHTKRELVVPGNRQERQKIINDLNKDQAKIYSTLQDQEEELKTEKNRLFEQEREQVRQQQQLKKPVRRYAKRRPKMEHGNINLVNVIHKI
jgi:hypothetical protein